MRSCTDTCWTRSATSVSLQGKLWLYSSNYDYIITMINYLFSDYQSDADFFVSFIEMFCSVIRLDQIQSLWLTLKLKYRYRHRSGRFCVLVLSVLCARAVSVPPRCSVSIHVRVSVPPWPDGLIGQSTSTKDLPWSQATRLLAGVVVTSCPARLWLVDGFL